jgi:hypothetical protein
MHAQNHSAATEPLSTATNGQAQRAGSITPVAAGALSPSQREEAAAAAEIFRRPLLPSQLGVSKPPAASWLWKGYLCSGKMTLLTSQWKSGKTTLVSVLLARMGQGGPLAGLPVATGRAAVVTEEDQDDWDRRCGKLHIGDHVSLYCRPFLSRPTRAQWEGMVRAFLEMRRERGLDLLVIDPLALFLPGNSENAAGEVIEGLLRLRQLTAAGVCVLLLHHPRKGRLLAGQAARGSGALAGHVDIVIEMSGVSNPDDPDRRRRLCSYSRYQETPRHMVLELTPDGTDYVAHAVVDDGALTGGWHALRLVLEDASERLTQHQIRDQWLEDFPKPDQATISRGLQRGLEQGLIIRQGSGRKNDPYRYWLPGKEEDFIPGPNASKEEEERYNRRCLAKFYEAIGVDPALAEKTPRASKDVEAKPTSLTATLSSPQSALERGNALVQPAEVGLAWEEIPMPVANEASLEPIEVAPQARPVPSSSAGSTHQVRPAKSSKPLLAAESTVLDIIAQEPDAVTVEAAVESVSEAAPAPPATPAAPPVPIRRMQETAPELSLEEQRIRLRMWPS